MSGPGAAWVTAWAMAHCGLRVYARAVAGRTLSVRIPCLVAGGTVRIGLSNRYGEETAVVAAASVNGLPLRFAGAEGLVLPAGAEADSDPLPLPVTAGSVLEVRLYLPPGAQPLSGNALAQAAYSAPGNHTGAGEFPVGTEDLCLNPDMPEGFGQPAFLLSRLDVLANPPPRPGVAVFGDSNAYAGLWTGPLSRQLALRGTALLNLSVSGNRLLRDSANPALHGIFGCAGVRRYGWDIAPLRGVGTLVLALGTNDLYQPGTEACPDASQLPTAAELLVGLRQIADRARRDGLRVLCATIPPLGGSETACAARLETWEAVNAGIRAGQGFDNVADFAYLVGKGTRLDPRCDAGDHIHLNPAGGLHIAQGVLNLLPQGGTTHA